MVNYITYFQSNRKVRKKLRFKSTASDISFVASDSLKKVGFNEGANILKKFAQEVAAPPEDAPVEAPGFMVSGTRPIGRN